MVESAAECSGGDVSALPQLLPITEIDEGQGFSALEGDQGFLTQPAGTEPLGSVKDGKGNLIPLVDLTHGGDTIIYPRHAHLEVTNVKTEPSDLPSLSCFPEHERHGRSDQPGHTEQFQDAEYDGMFSSCEDAHGYLYDEGRDATSSFLSMQGALCNVARGSSEGTGHIEEIARCNKDVEHLDDTCGRKRKAGVTSYPVELVSPGAKLQETVRQRQARGRENTEQDEDSLFLPEEPIARDEVARVDPEDGEAEDCEASPSVQEKRPQNKKLNKGKVAKVTPAKRQTRPKKGKGKANGTLLATVHDLYNHDMIAQANRNEDLESQPSLGQGTKQRQLDALIASMPESERDLHKGDKRKLLDASTKFSARGIVKGAGALGWKHKHMITHLHHYQLLAVAWMREQENKPESTRGGILADQMGFGKTVISIANIVDGRPPATFTGARATLIVVPPMLRRQWLAEVQKHAGDSLRNVMGYSSTNSSGPMFANILRSLASQDIVITSYGELVKSMPKNEPPKQLFTARAKAEWWKSHYQANKGVLHQIPWYRVILDEAHVIKNPSTRTCQAAIALPGRYRWCLSGTPIQNGLTEFYSYFAFLRCKMAGPSFELFKRNYCKPGSEAALQRLQFLLSKVMYRRTHDSKLFGRPILKLMPIKPIQTIVVNFNRVERALYQIVRNRFVAKMSIVRQNTENETKQSYNCAFVLLLRLRQLVGHPLLVQKTLKDLLEAEDIEKLNRVSQSTSSEASNDHDDGSVATARALGLALAHARLDDPLTQASKESINDNKFSKDFVACLRALRDSGQQGKINERCLCHQCGNTPTKPRLTKCLHIYCDGCLNKLWNGARKLGKDYFTCLECQTVCHDSESCEATVFDEVYNDHDRGGSRQSRQKSGSGEEEDIDWYTIKPVLRSAKITGAADQIKKWFDEDSTRKIVVFAQFRGMIRAMKLVCDEEQWGSVVYTGDVSMSAREEAIANFTHDRNCRILLMGLKAGGVGLNLIAGSRCIILDLWFNFMTEAQAYCRIWRMGQMRDVEVVRFVVKNSVDEAMLRMQERKTKEINGAMQEDSQTRLGMHEIVQLFSEEVSDLTEDGADVALEQINSEPPFIHPNDPYAEKSDDEGMEAMEIS